MFVKVETHAGNPISVGESKIVPLAKVVRLQIPGWLGGIIWNRPVAVVVQTGEDQEQIVPVVDVTRAAQVIIFGSGFFVALMAYLINRRNNKRP
jgi:hypothetical protein